MQYLNLHPFTAWAELLRFGALTRADELAQLRHPIWALRIRLDAEPLELTFDNAPEHRLTAKALVADDHGPCRAFAARRDGQASGALIAPSAALPGTRNLVLFGPRVGIPYDAEPIDPQDVPLSVITLRGYAPVGLLESVHHRGASQTHAGLAAWRERRELAWREPRLDSEHGRSVEGDGQLRVQPVTRRRPLPPPDVATSWATLVPERANSITRRRVWAWQRRGIVPSLLPEGL